MTEKQNDQKSLNRTLYEWRLEQVEEKTNKLGDQVDKLGDRTSHLEKQTSELKIYITNILETVQTISGDFKKLDELSDKRHDTQQEKWTGFFQKITYLVIGAIITYLFSQFR